MLSSCKSICSCGHTTSSGMGIIRIFSTSIIANNPVRAYRYKALCKPVFKDSFKVFLIA